VEIAIPIDAFGESVTLDPHRAIDWGLNWVLLPYVWSGLVAFDENGAVVLDLAEALEPGETAAEWTATLREGIAFAGGSPITAGDFVSSWKRALDPAHPSPMVSFMSLVEGYDAYLAGEGSELGFEAVDDRTIRITLSEPSTSFPSYLACFVWAVIDPAVLAAEPATFPLADAGAGQWRFTEFVDRERIVMEPNPAYWDGGSPSVVRINWPFMDSTAAATDGIAAYKDDTIVSLDVPASLRPSVEGDEVLAADLVTIENPSSTLAVGMDFNQEPFGDMRVRQAVAAAIDREAWVAGDPGGSWVAATAFTPPSVSVTSGYEPAQSIAFDAGRAADLVSEAGFQTGDAQIEIIYRQPASDPAEVIALHASLLAMIESNAGIRITHDTSLTSDQIAALQADNGGRQFDLVWWWSTTATPALLATVGASQSPYNAGWFNWSPELEGDAGTSSSEFDTAVAAAESSLDEAERLTQWQTAERLLLDNAVYVPLGHWVQRFIQKPWLQGTRQGPWSGRLPVRIDKDVFVSGRS
jgi:ABC-type transport system substrate-binding protein